MSNFQCEQCGTILYDTPEGYVTQCEHYPVLVKPLKEIKLLEPEFSKVANDHFWELFRYLSMRNN